MHQGDGTARMLAGDDRIFTCSLHCRSNYGRGAVSDLDVEIEKVRAMMAILRADGYAGVSG